MTAQKVIQTHFYFILFFLAKPKTKEKRLLRKRDYFFFLFLEKAQKQAIISKNK